MAGCLALRDANAATDGEAGCEGKQVEGSGVVVFMGSIVMVPGKFGKPITAIYCASKVPVRKVGLEREPVKRAGAAIFV
jgi:hypothetical protein